SGQAISLVRHLVIVWDPPWPYQGNPEPCCPSRPQDGTTASPPHAPPPAPALPPSSSRPEPCLPLLAPFRRSPASPASARSAPRPAPLLSSHRPVD
ncbi:hypothetical protein BRADI_3g17320v3, partial [Brachypodium distachyon]